MTRINISKLETTNHMQTGYHLSTVRLRFLLYHGVVRWRPLLIDWDAIVPVNVSDLLCDSC